MIVAKSRRHGMSHLYFNLNDIYLFKIIKIEKRKEKIRKILNENR